MDLRDVNYARDLFTELVVAWSMRSAGPPDESETNALAGEALEMANVLRAAQAGPPTAALPDLSSTRRTQSSPMFAEVMVDWMNRVLKRKTPNRKKLLANSFRRHVFPYLGNRPIGDLKSSEILSVIRSIEGGGHFATAYEMFSYTRYMYRYALAAGLTDQDPTEILRRVFRRQRSKGGMNMVLDRESVGRLLVAIRDYKGTPRSTAKYLLRLAPLVFLRPTELRMLQWQNVDLDAATIVIPASAMKNGTPHVVPLARQAVHILRDVHKITGYGEFVFISGRYGDKPFDFTIYYTTIQSIGFAGRVTAHGFRTLAASWLSEQGWRQEAISGQLSHRSSERALRSYNRAQYLPERRKMMQAWADHLEALERKTRMEGGSHAST